PSGLNAKSLIPPFVILRTCSGALPSRRGQFVVTVQRATLAPPAASFVPTAIILPEGSTATRQGPDPGNARRSMTRPAAASQIAHSRDPGGTVLVRATVTSHRPSGPNARLRIGR